MRGAWAPGFAIGIRPVLTWKSTAAAPTPTREGPCEVPSPLSPWQEEHVTWNSALPSATWAEVPLAQSQTIVDADVANISDRVAKFSFLRASTDQRTNALAPQLLVEFLREVGYAAAISLTLRLPAACGYTFANGSLENIAQVNNLAFSVTLVTKPSTPENPVVPQGAFEVEAIASTSDRQRRATLKVTVV